MKKTFLSFFLFFVAYLSYATTGGPYPMDYNASIDDDEAKVIVYSSPFYSGGSLWIKNQETNESYFIQSSSTYYAQWFYVIPRGIYIITSIANGYSVQTQGSTRSVYDTIDFTSGGGYIMLIPNY
jgi:hypothetical protein